MHIHFCSVPPLYPLTMCSGAVIYLSTLIVLSPSYILSFPQTQKKENWFFKPPHPQIEVLLKLGRRALLLFFSTSGRCWNDSEWTAWYSSKKQKKKTQKTKTKHQKTKQFFNWKKIISMIRKNVCLYGRDFLIFPTFTFKFFLLLLAFMQFQVYRRIF